MRRPRPRWWQRLNQRIPASRPGAWLFSRTLHHVDRMLYRISGGRLSVPAVVTGLPVVMLTTTGVRSGRPRTVPVVGMRDGERVVVIASNWGRGHHPAWYGNLLAHPEAMVVAPGLRGTYVAREATGAEREQYWRRAVELYRGFPAYERRAGGRSIPVVVLSPKSG